MADISFTRVLQRANELKPIIADRLYPRRYELADTALSRLCVILPIAMDSEDGMKVITLGEMTTGNIFTPRSEKMLAENMHIIVADVLAFHRAVYEVGRGARIEDLPRLLIPNERARSWIAQDPFRRESFIAMIFVESLFHPLLHFSVEATAVLAALPDDEYNRGVDIVFRRLLPFVYDGDEEGRREREKAKRQFLKLRENLRRTAANLDERDAWGLAATISVAWRIAAPLQVTMQERLAAATEVMTALSLGLRPLDQIVQAVHNRNVFAIIAPRLVARLLEAES